MWFISLISWYFRLALVRAFRALLRRDNYLLDLSGILRPRKAKIPLRVLFQSKENAFLKCLL
jgi:hypothetical protein